MLCAGLLLHAQETTRIDLGGGQTLELVRVEAGSFEQGSPANEAGRGADETQHHVTLTRPFLLGKYPVTRGQFARFVTETHYRTDAESGPSGGFGWDGTQLTQRKEFNWHNPGFSQTDEHPVTLVSYRDAFAFLQWLTRKSERPFNLPSEAQWEYAARAGKDGTVKAAEYAWFRGNSGNATHPVGEKALNAWGLGDMMGNVWEWCEDWYAPYPAGEATDPLQRNDKLSDKPRRVLRGGSWMREEKFCRPAARYRNDAQSRNADNGFRVMTFQVDAAPAIPVEAPRATTTSSANPTRVDPISGAQPVSRPTDSPLSPRFTSPPKSAPGFLWLLLVPFFGILLFVLRMIVRAFSSAVSGNLGGRGGPAGGFQFMPGQPMRVRIADDGFWVVADGVAAGSLITCRYEIDGGQQQMDIRYEPGPQGQFVFTGARPANVSVSLQNSGGGTVFEDTGGGSILTSSSRHDTPRFRGNPPAY